ncbi:hypothetical protein [Flavitalea sp.]|nr:hypothetical protein [Flavitalea sp.]
MSKLSTTSVSANNDTDDKKLRKGVFFRKSGDTNPRKGLWGFVEVILVFLGLISK